MFGLKKSAILRSITPYIIAYINAVREFVTIYAIAAARPTKYIYDI